MKREHYLEHNALCGHSVYLLAPLNCLNLLPVEATLQCGAQLFRLPAGQQVPITALHLRKKLRMSLATDTLSMRHPVPVRRKDAKPKAGAAAADPTKHRLLFRLLDHEKRTLDVYARLVLHNGDALYMTFFVMFWVVNRTGLPLVLKKTSGNDDACGQGSNHESSPVLSPLMLSDSSTPSV